MKISSTGASLTAYFQQSARRSSTYKRSPWLYLALTPPSPGDRGGINVIAAQPSVHGLGVSKRPAQQMLKGIDVLSPLISVNCTPLELNSPRT
jgi:hypothetical protein